MNSDQDKIDAFIAAGKIQRCPDPFTEELAVLHKQRHEIWLKSIHPSTKRVWSFTETRIGKGRVYESGGRHMDPEKSLALAKILTMLENVAGKSREPPSMRSLLQAEAYRWFFSGNSDIQYWCDDADMNISDVRNKARELYDHGMAPVRAPAGSGKRFEERRRYREKERINKKGG